MSWDLRSSDRQGGGMFPKTPVISLPSILWQLSFSVDKLWVRVRAAVKDLCL